MAKVNLETNINKLLEDGEICELEAKELSELRKMGNPCEIRVYEHQAFPFLYCFYTPDGKEPFEKFLEYEEAVAYLKNELENMYGSPDEPPIRNGSATCPWNAEGMRISDFI